MKKLIFTTVLMLLSNLIFAQSQWSITYNEADELKETEACYVNSFITENGDAFICQNNHEGVRIYTNKGIFHTFNNFVQLTIGFYVDNKLIEKKEVWLFVPSGQANIAYSNRYKQKKIGKKIKEHLKTSGDIRIIAKRYSDPDFDIIIPKNPEIKITL